MKLNELRNREGATHRRKVLGRGIGSGLGKTSGRGVKGQKARTGVSVNGFEGGQMPLYRRTPKRGFTSLARLDYAEVSLARLQAAVDAGQLDPAGTVDAAALVKAGLIRRVLDGVRVLGPGALKSKLAFVVDGASAPARAAIEAAGGSITIVARPQPQPGPKDRPKKDRAKKPAAKS
ncbi:MAG: 50S ribosomal protein L15 [Rhodospirillaceae bacterium]|nr:50S ribosomal protein L15 [Rhodospirillaceae bacterium]